MSNGIPITVGTPTGDTAHLTFTDNALIITNSEHIELPFNSIQFDDVAVTDEADGIVHIPRENDSYTDYDITPRDTADATDILILLAAAEDEAT